MTCQEAERLSMQASPQNRCGANDVAEPQQKLDDGTAGICFCWSKLPFAVTWHSLKDC